MENIESIGKQDNHHSTYHIHLAKEIILRKACGAKLMQKKRINIQIIMMHYLSFWDIVILEMLLNTSCHGQGKLSMIKEA